ncbi:MAG: hypothetical protein HY709_09670 [Candidatus Latescibacteria bacterium]|nr:hypothetical protein [Candidatus Latescibacterota bacterium]
MRTIPEGFFFMIDNPDLCIIRASRGERISQELGRFLDPVDPTTIHEYVLPANTPVELHYHDFDEYWLFRSGEPLITLRAPNGTIRQYQLSPGDMVACLHGVAHTLAADHDLVYFQFSSVRREGARGGHLPVGE